MKKFKIIAVWMSSVLLLTGVYILQYSVAHHGRYADDWILIGALLSAFAFAATALFIRFPRPARVVDRHLRRE